jgi:hypothetical protein
MLLQNLFPTGVYGLNEDSFSVRVGMYDTVVATRSSGVWSLTADGDAIVASNPATDIATAANAAGTKTGSTVSVQEYGQGEVLHKTVLTFTATPVTITDDPAVSQYGGTGLIYTFPEGLICTFGAVISGSVTLGTTGTIINTWTGAVALGTVTATTGATLVSTEANIMPSVAVSAATAKVAAIPAVSVATALTESGARWLDGTTTPVPAFLNLVVTDDATHTSGTGTFTGVVTIMWAQIGDK